MRLPFVQRLGYGLGDFGFQLFFLTASLYLLYYYTDVLGLSPATAGWVFAVPLVWDAVSDPIIGFLANRTRTKWGRYRPFLLFSAIPLAGAWALIFVPLELTGAQLIAFAFAAHFLFRTLYGIAAMPYLALSAAMTTDSSERSILAAFRMIAAAGAGIFVAFGTLQLVEALGGDRIGFFRVSLLYGAIAVALLMLVFFTAREPALESESKGPPPSFGAIFSALLSNRPFWIVGAALLIGSFAGVFFNKNLPYYMKYAVGEERLIGPSLGIVTLAITLSIPLWTVMMKRTSKRLVFLIGAAIALAGYAAVWLAPQTAAMVLPMLAIVGLGTGAIYLSTWAMMPDTVEYGEWKSGVRAEGALFGVVSFLQKASLGLAAGMLGESLSAIGYQPNATQTPETIEALRTIMIAVPAAVTVVMAAAIAFYPLDGKAHARLVEDLAARKATEATP